MPRREAGVTLLELLLVLLLMGTLLGLVSLTGGRDPSREARQHARGVLDLLRLGQQLATLEGREFGLCVAVGKVYLMRWQGQGWVEHGHGLATAYDLHLRVENRHQWLGPVCEQPQVLLSGTEAGAAFSLHLDRQGQRLVSLIGDGHNAAGLDE